MRTSVVLLIAVVGGYFAYHLWFAPEEVEQSDLELVDESETRAEPERDNEAEPQVRRRNERRVSIRIGGNRLSSAPAGAAVPALDEDDPREDEAWELMDRLKEARKGGEKAEAGRLVHLIEFDYSDTDAGRLVSFERGNAALQRFMKLGRTAEGYVAAQEARKYLTPALFLSDEVVAKEQRIALRKRLRKLADEMLFGGRHIEGVDRLYETRRGDTLDVLCRKVFRQKWGDRVAPGLVMAVNRIRRAQDLRANVNIRVPAGEAKIVVAAHEFRLYFMLDGAYVRDWPVGLGAEASSTPLGSFRIRTKLVEPDWFPRQGVKIPFGDRRNILGNRWMGFQDTPQFTGFGIHGTTKPQSIGKRESSGCIRMRRQDVEELFSWTPRQTVVEIRR